MQRIYILLLSIKYKLKMEKSEANIGEGDTLIHYLIIWVHLDISCKLT